VFSDGSILENHDLVGAVDGGEAVSDDDPGSFLEEFCDCMIDAALRGRIKAR
jgi:hypothetical protein